MKIRPVRAELFHADRRTNMKLIVTFRNSDNAPKMKQKSKTKQILKGSVDGRITWYLDFI
jgi:hypothetical protein